MTEEEKLKTALLEFTDQMRYRLLWKTKNHWHGWNEPRNLPRLMSKLHHDCEKIVGLPNRDMVDYNIEDCVDLANYAMFLYNLKASKDKET